MIEPLSFGVETMGLGYEVTRPNMLWFEVYAKALRYQFDLMSNKQTDPAYTPCNAVSHRVDHHVFNVTPELDEDHCDIWLYQDTTGNHTRKIYE